MVAKECSLCFALWLLPWKKCTISHWHRRWCAVYSISNSGKKWQNFSGFCNPSQYQRMSWKNHSIPLPRIYDEIHSMHEIIILLQPRSKPKSGTVLRKTNSSDLTLLLPAFRFVSLMISSLTWSKSKISSECRNLAHSRSPAVPEEKSILWRHNGRYVASHRPLRCGTHCPPPADISVAKPKAASLQCLNHGAEIPDPRCFQEPSSFRRSTKREHEHTTQQWANRYRTDSNARSDCETQTCCSMEDHASDTGTVGVPTNVRGSRPTYSKRTLSVVAIEIVPLKIFIQTLVRMDPCVENFPAEDISATKLSHRWRIPCVSELLLFHHLTNGSSQVEFFSRSWVLFCSKSVYRVHISNSDEYAIRMTSSLRGERNSCTPTDKYIRVAYVYLTRVTQVLSVAESLRSKTNRSDPVSFFPIKVGL